MSPRDRPHIALGGLLFVVLFVVSSFVVPSTPGSHATAAKVISFYHKHKTVVAVNAWIIEVAVFVGVIFFWYLRDTSQRSERTGGWQRSASLVSSCSPPMVACRLASTLCWPTVSTTSPAPPCRRLTSSRTT